MLYKVVILSVFIILTLQSEGVIVNSQFTNYTCLKENGRDLVIIRGLQSIGLVDTAALNNIKFANQAGFLTDVHMAVCPGKSAATQVNEMIDYLEGSTLRKDRLLFEIKEQEIKSHIADSIFDRVYGNIWIDVETNSALGCSWQAKTQAQNCDYIRQVINAIETRGRSAGISSSASYWNQITGENCTNFTKYPVMYSNIGSEASFKDWRSFGGWNSPNVKNYNSQSLVCGTRFGLAYF